MAFDSSMSVLVVDDRDAEIQILRALLRQLGLVNVDDAHDAAEALTRMRATRYGLVISDWLVKPATACEFVREVRGDPRLQRTPFIVSGEAKPENVIAAKKAGANSYIVKPFSAEMLKPKIETAFATRIAPMPERQPSTAASPPPAAASRPSPPSQASDATSTSAAGQKKFDGLYTSSL
jgi:two-component system, chemotaxis family, chemotaxis protein CheY